MGDGTPYRDCNSAYRKWERKVERKRMFKKAIVIALLVSSIFIFGMATQYMRDNEMRNMATDCMNRDIAVIQSMPEPTAAQIAEAKKRAKKITPQYLSERNPK